VGNQPIVGAPQAASAAAFGANAYADHIGARLLEFFADTTPWQRRLWDAGTVLALRELDEAVRWTDLKVLGAATTRWLAHDLERLTGRDRAIGERELRQQLTAVLRSSLAYGSRHHRRLRQLLEMVQLDYLDRWAAAVDGGNLPAPERVSRAIAAHLLDLGYRRGYLHRWARALVQGGATLRQLLESACSLAVGQDAPFEVLVPFRSVPRQVELTAGVDEWRDGPQVATWLRDHAGDPKGVRQSGGFLYTITAKDPYAAASAAAAIVERLVARSSYARSAGSGLEPLGRLFVGDAGVDLPLRQPARGAHVLSLVAEKRLYAVTGLNALDDALELAAPLNHGSAGPAISGGWAAVEALLVAPLDAEDAAEGRGVVAADRLAALIACSWPRAEFTGLSYRHNPATQDRLQGQLRSTTINRERSRLVADALASGRTLALASSGDQAAEARMRALMAAPRRTLMDVTSAMRTAMRRLYRQRNILLHGGATSSIALLVTLRTAAPLVGAGLDRITHAWLTNAVEPLDLAERAQISLALVGGPDGPHVCDLLE